MRDRQCNRHHHLRRCHRFLCRDWFRHAHQRAGQTRLGFLRDLVIGFEGTVRITHLAQQRAEY